MRRLFPGAAELQVAACITFHDHILYKDSDLDRNEKAAHKSEAKAFVTTNKELARLGALAEAFPATHPLKTARLSIEIEDEEVEVGLPRTG